MFLFLRLLLGHFLGDFPFQFNAVFKLKLKGFFGIIPHVAIILACCIGLSWPYLNNPHLWLFIIFIGVTHLVQDWAKIRFGTLTKSFWPYVADQASHVATIAVVLLTPLKNLTPPAGDSLLTTLYNDDLLVKCLIALIVATYNGYFMIRCFKDTFIGRANCNTFEKWYGFSERAAIVFSFFLGGFWLFLLPVLLFLRPPVFALAHKRFSLHPDFKARQDILLSWMAALCAAVVLYLL